MLLELLIMIVKIGLVLGAVLTAVPIMVCVERRGAAYIQNRPGPNRV